MHLRRTLVALCTLATALAAWPDQAAGQSERQQADPLINLDFAGGRLADYVAAIRKNAPGANILIKPPAEAVAVPAVELRSVHIATALKILAGLEQRTVDGLVEVEFDVDESGVEGARPIYVIEAQVSNRRAFPEQSIVLGVGALIDGGVSPEALLTAIEASLELHGEGAAQPARIRFHRDTALIIARGTPDQMDSITQVVKGAQSNVSAKDEQARMMAAVGERAKLDELSRMVAGLEMQNDLLRAELEKSKAAVAELTAQLNTVLGLAGAAGKPR